MTIHIGQFLRQWALRTPGNLALIGSEEITYHELERRTRRYVGGLKTLGVEPGDRVALCAANGLEYIQAWFAIVYAGASVVPLPVVSAPLEIKDRTAHANVARILVDRERANLVQRAGLEFHFIDELSGTPGELDNNPEGIAMILYTSGTTGEPKGAVITHQSLALHTAALVHHTLRLKNTDIILGALPFSHSFGLRMTLLAPFFAGARVVLPERSRFDAHETLAECERENVTWLCGVPTMFHAWSETSGNPLSRLKWCLCAGAPLSEETRKRAQARLGAKIRQGYGLTEATFSSIDAPHEPQTVGSVGKPVWGVEIQVRSRDNDLCAPDEIGEITIRGQNLMREYLDAEKATNEALRGGWLSSGDLGYLDKDGNLFIVGRRRDLILRGGHNVYPSDVENVLSAYPEILEVAVVGRPDPHYGEEIVAFVVRRDPDDFNIEALRYWMEDRLSKTKRPREIVFVDALPLGPSRKILRRELQRRIEMGTVVCRRL